MKSVVVGTAGHVDHGKSALVEALTGTNPDRLEEEKRRGITIDLGFAFAELGDVGLGFVDVPGHERFVRNMLAGVGGIDVVLLVIAADESVKPQTREHFDICRLLAIPRGLIALTKADLVERDMLELVRGEVNEFVRGSFLHGAPIIPVSARTGAGLDRLKQELRRVASEVPGKDAGQYFRLPIDRAFAMKGFGTVVTGTLISGEVRAEDEVELLPAGRRIRVRGVQSSGRRVEHAVAGQRTAVNLVGIELAEVARGMVLVSPGRLATTRRLDARIVLLPSARRMKRRTRVHFHQGTMETVAEVILLEAMDLAPGQSALAQLRLEDSVLVIPGDRFILRQFSPVVTIGGGVVLDAHAARHRQRDVDVVAFLRTLERGNREEILAALAAACPQGLEMAAIVARTGWLESVVRATATQLAQAGTVRILSEQPLVLASAERVAACVERVRQEVESFHRSNPLAEGIPKEELRARVAGKARPELFRAVLEELQAAGSIVVSGDTVKRAGRQIALLPEEARAKEQIELAFARAGLAVPSLRETLAGLPVEAGRAHQLVQLLLRERVLIKVAEDLVFHHSALHRLRELIGDYKVRHGNNLSISAFKEIAAVSRKYAIPLLEYLDRERVTRRVGDVRVIL